MEKQNIRVANRAKPVAAVNMVTEHGNCSKDAVDISGKVHSYETDISDAPSDDSDHVDSDDDL